MMRYVDRIAAWWLGRRGYSVVETTAQKAARVAIAELSEYVDKSGHLNTVSGRRPRAIERLRKSLGAAFTLTEPASLAGGSKREEE